MTMPVILSLMAANILAVILVTRTGYNAPFLIASSVFMSIGGRLILTFTTMTGFMQLKLTAQTAQEEDVPTGLVLMFFRNLGGALFVSIGENAFKAKPTRGLENIPDLNAEVILRA
ncbi:hypothetical protein F4677DRAFT_440476 [Hypoxylon crocopeplum]|nr:hypothetical protein F4677DRAFT_440476 [Hypoxylon crocopeplum]